MGFNSLETGLVAVALIVMFGGPIWFSVKARELGPLPYRWGTYVGIWSLLFSFALLSSVATEFSGSSRLLVGLVPMLEMAGAIGVLRRKRWGVVLLLTSHVALILARLLLTDNDQKPTLPQFLAGVAGIAINAWYFGRRWQFMGIPADFGPEEDPGESDPEVQPADGGSVG